MIEVLMRQIYSLRRNRGLLLLSFSAVLACQHSGKANHSSKDLGKLTSHSQRLCHTVGNSEAAYLCQIELYLTMLTNEYRYQYGMPPLRHYPALSYVAQEQSRRAAHQGRISHDGFPQTRQLILSQYDLSERQVIKAENLLFFKTREKDPEKLARRIFQFWQNSPDHRRQVLGPYQAHGASLVLEQSQIYAAAMFQ